MEEDMAEESKKAKIPILVVDDDVEFVDNLVKDADRYDLLIVHRTNYRDMEEVLPRISGSIACIVLDLKCLIEPNSSVPREDFLMKALRLLDQKYPHIPRYVLTGDSAGYEHVKVYSTDEKIFKKLTSEIFNLFQEIHSLDVELIKLRSRYSDVFSIIQIGIFPKETEAQLISLLSNINKEDFVTISDNLSRVRKVQESIFQTINKEKPRIIPDYLLKDGSNVNFWDLHKHLKGNPTKESNYKPIGEVFYSGPVDILSETIYAVASDHGSHNTPYENSDYRPTKYTVQACTNALLDLILWSGHILKKTF